MRLIQVAKEFKVGFNTLADFLQRKGLQSDCSPSSPVSDEVYAALEKEFGRNRQSGNERNAVRERIQQKGSVSINNDKEEEQEVVVKSTSINVKDEVRGPKILGKIDLNPKPKAEPKPAPKPEPKPEPKPAPAPKAEPKVEAPAPKAEPVAEAPKRDSVYRTEVEQL
ncbi:MAG: translation initiation factor IF-2, partial [Alistipes sp.]|nr:translation initiation factor IF-2 [Alistipes sp.]